MQFNSPFCGSGFPNYRQFHHCNPYLQHALHPEVIGEGDVVSVIFPDGSVHFYFIPTSKRNAPFCDPYIPSHNPYCNGGPGAFYIRSISNPMSAAVFNQQWQKVYGMPLTRPSLFPDCNANLPIPPFQLKFHNDSWTSTTDLRYFYPRVRQCECGSWSPKQCTAVQTDKPAKSPNVCQIACDRRCLCSRDSNVSEKCSEIDMVDECRCDKVHKSHSRSSMSSGKEISKTKLKKSKSILKLKKHKPKKIVKKSSNLKCECHEPDMADKSVTTYADQASSCTAAESNTQTTPINCAQSFLSGIKRILSKGDIKTELWFPKSCNKPVDIISSEKIIGVYETDCSSASCCCSAMGADDRN